MVVFRGSRHRCIPRSDGPVGRSTSEELDSSVSPWVRDDDPPDREGKGGDDPVWSGDGTHSCTQSWRVHGKGGRVIF